MIDKIYFIFVFALLCSVAIYASDIRKETYTFAIKGVDTLRLDKYDLSESTKSKACIIFAFGGGFFAGKRDGNEYINYFQEMAKSGYTVISIDYRLGLKDLNLEEIKSPIEIIAVLKRTINDTVEDLFDATTYVINHSGEWGINKDQIIASGSSAGAITVLQAEYEICNDTKLANRLPKNFNYAGVTSFAGAILSLNGELNWKKKPTPMQLFHGNADGNVPYDALEFFNIGFYGSETIAKQMERMNVPYYFYDVDNANHSIANSPMKQNITEIKTFIDRFVVKKEQLKIHNKVHQLGEKSKKKKFTIMDYLLNNFS